MAILHKVLEEIEELPFEEKLFLEEEIHKRNLVIRRNFLLNDIENSKKDFKEGKYKSFSSATDFLQELNDDNF